MKLLMFVITLLILGACATKRPEYAYYPCGNCICSYNNSTRQCN